jgi:hypothetical protein
MHPAIKTVWDKVPSVIQDAIASTVDKATGVQVDPVPVVPTSYDVRMFIAPANYAGQANQWGRAAMANPAVVSRNMIAANINGFGYAVDYAVPWRTMTHNRRWQRELLATLADNYTHVMFEAAMPVLGGMLGGDVVRQAELLREKGLTVGMIAHGTEVRLPSRHRDLVRWSYFANDDWVPVDLFERAVARNIDIFDRVAAPTFASTAGLLLDLPYAHLLPVVIDPGMWATEEPVLERKRLRLLHAPSNPLPKGTFHIAPVIEKLESEGLVEYVSVTERTQAEMPALYASADIVLDQFRAGDYGVASCEAMASGRLVIAHVSGQVRESFAELAGMELPIVEAEIDTLEDVLRDIIANRSTYAQIASHGPEYVRRAHDGRLSRDVLERHFLFG